MGMFDDISVAESLPYSDEMIALGLNTNDRSFQTKDLDCVMAKYYIQSRKLFIEKYKKENYIEGDKKSKNIFDRIGYMDRQEPYLEEVFHHGEIYFYDFIQDVDGKYDCWVEFKAVFTKGELDTIELFKFSKEDNTERKEREREWAENIKKENSMWYNKFIFHTRGYVRVSRFIGRLFYKLGSAMHKISYKL